MTYDLFFCSLSTEIFFFENAGCSKCLYVECGKCNFKVCFYFEGQNLETGRGYVVILRRLYSDADFDLTMFHPRYFGTLPCNKLRTSSIN